MYSELTTLELLIKSVEVRPSKYGYYPRLFNWCEDIYASRDRIMALLHYAIYSMEEEPAEQMLYIFEHVGRLQNFIAELPDSLEKFERRIITENLNDLIEFLKQTFHNIVPLAPGGYLYEAYTEYLQMGMAEREAWLTA